MDSTINLLPEKDKQLKRDGGIRKQSAEMVEMTKPQDRVFQERVVRMEGVLAFFKNIFRRAPKLPQPKAKEIIPPAPPKPIAAAPRPAAPVTKMETMMDRLPGKEPVAKPPAPPLAGNFLTKLFSKSEKPARPVTGNRPPLIVPPPPSGAPLKVLPPPAPAHRAPSWAPPPPPGKPVAQSPALVPPLPPKPVIAPAPMPPPIPTRLHQAPSVSKTTEAQPMLGNSLNVNLVPERYQPEASVKERLLAATFVAGAALLVAAVSIGLYFYQRTLQTKVNTVEDEIQQVSASIRSIETIELQEAQILSARTADVKRALDQHVYWDMFFKNLESVTLPGVSYSSMNVDVSGTVSISGMALTYEDVGNQLLTFQKAKDFITDVTITSGTLVQQSQDTQTSPSGTTAPVQTRVTFNATLRVNPTVFYRR